MKRIFTAALLQFLFLPCYAQESVTFSEDNQFYMLVKLNSGIVATDSLEAYQVGTRWFLPLEDLAQSLGVAIYTTPGLGLAKGFIINENRTFSLDVKSCHFVLSDRLENYPCDLAIIYQDAIYVDQQLIERFMPLLMNVDPYSSTIYITEKEPLPIAQKLQRAKVSIINKAGGEHSTIPVSQLPHKQLDGLFIDQQIGLTTEKQSGETSDTFNHTTSMSGELLKMEAQATLAGDEDSFSQTKLNLSKKSTTSDLLGPLRASKYELVDIQYPVVPLISQGKSGQGVEITNFPLYTPSSITTHRFTGNLPVGWDVELYQDGSLIGRQTTDASGVYDFKNITLNYGVNRFKFIYYGPQGQRKEEYKTFDIRASQLKKGADNYRVNYTKVAGDDERLLAEYRRGISDNTTLQTAYSRLLPTDAEKMKSYGLLGLSSYWDSFLVNTSLVTEEGAGWAAQILTQMQLDASSIGFSRTEVDNFVSEELGNSNGTSLIHQTKVNASTVLFKDPGLRLGLEGIKNEYKESANDSYDWNLRLSTSIGRVFLFNDLLYVKRANDYDLNGEFSALRAINSGNIRAIASYDKREVTALSLETQMTLAKHKLNIGVERKLVEHITTFIGGLSRHFQKFDLSLNASVSTDDNYLAQMFLTYGLQGDASHDKWRFGADYKAQHGAAAVFIYIDKNNSGTYDEGDSPQPEIEISVNQTGTNILTDDSGYAFVSGLQPYQSVVVGVMESSIKNPFYRLKQTGFNFIPRPGKTMQVELGFIVTGDIDGTVVVDRTKSGQKNMEIEVVSTTDNSVVAATTTETDGYFSFSGIPQGNYKVRINNENLNRRSWKSVPREILFEITDEGLSEGEMNFRLVAD